MSIYIGDKEIKDLCIGDSSAKEVYLGENKVRPKATPDYPIISDNYWVSEYNFPTQGITFNPSEYQGPEGTTINMINEDSFSLMLPGAEQGISMQSLPQLYSLMQYVLPEGFPFSLDDGTCVDCRILEINDTTIYEGYDGILTMFYIDGLDDYQFPGYGLNCRISSYTDFSGFTACIFYFLIEQFNQYNGYPMCPLNDDYVRVDEVYCDTTYLDWEISEEIIDWAYGAKLLVLPIVFYNS